MDRGRLITIEGLDGAGKSTLARALVQELGSERREVRLLREPGGVLAAERIRELVKDPSISLTPRAEALLYAAARAQLVEEALMPLLRRGTWVILDRFLDSSLAYQGGGRELGITAIRELNAFATGELVPDRTLLLVIDPEIGMERSRARSEPPDRLELESDQFRRRIQGSYLELAASEPARVRTIDASISPDEVLRRALDELSDLL